MQSESSGWLEGIRRATEDSQKREEQRNARLDKIITELDAASNVWYLNYGDGSDIAESILNHQLDHESVQAHNRYVQNRKRHIVEASIIPAMHACIRAGFVVPADEAKA